MFLFQKIHLFLVYNKILIKQEGQMSFSIQDKANLWFHAVYVLQM